MLPASNRTSGSCFAFPDTCKTPNPAGGPPVDVHYPNTGDNTAASLFALRVIICGGNAFNLASMIAVTTGDQPGVAHETFTGPATFLTGSPKVMIEGTPAVHLQSATYQNTHNANGTQIVPSATNVFYGYAHVKAPCSIVDHLVELEEAMHSASKTLREDMVEDGIGLLAIGVFTSDLPARAHAALERLRVRGARALVLELRGNPGGDVHAAMDFVSEFLSEGQVIATLVDADGDETVYRSYTETPNEWPLTVLVDRNTASAAEIVAGALRAHERAVLVGERTYGKGAVQAVVGGLEGPTYASVARVVLPDGTDIQGEGISVDMEVLGDGVLGAAMEGLMRRCA